LGKGLTGSSRLYGPGGNSLGPFIPTRTVPPGRELMADLFTPEERHTVILCLEPVAGRPEKRLWYVAFLLPSGLFALYGLWNQDFLAMLVAYIALLSVALMYLGRSSQRLDYLRTALEKYEAQVCALGQSSSQ